MKQTQTKYFSFEDVGLDFCTASSGLWMNRFEKMLATGYNEQTVSSVSVNNDATVVFTYAVAHDYAEDRVLKVDSGSLADINGGEFRIDAVTTNTVTMTIDGAPGTISGGFTTKVAPLGWEKVYENLTQRVHVFKMKSLDESDLYVRLFYTPASTVGEIYPCVGNSYDPTTGFINDPNANSYNSNILARIANTNYLRWMMANFTTTTPFSNFTYAQGYSGSYNFGRAMVVGSKYHFGLLNNVQLNDGGQIGFIVPAHTLDYPTLKLPITGGSNQASGTITNAGLKMYCGNIELTLLKNSFASTIRFPIQSVNSYLPSSIDPSEVSVAFSPTYYDVNNLNPIAIGTGAMMIAGFAGTVAPNRASTTNPSLMAEADFNHIVLVHGMGVTAHSFYCVFPIEEVKYVD